MPPASAGSQPVAWAVALGDKGRVLDGIYISKAKADEVLEWRNENTEYGARLIPLYDLPQPALTDEEREAVHRLCRAVTHYSAGGVAVDGGSFARDDDRAVAVVRGWLARLT
jgi:hypothetical protein